MSVTSKKHFSEDFKKEIWKPFLDKIKKARTREDILKVFDPVLNEQEKALMEKRLAAKFLLNKKMSYGDISKAVDMSKATVYLIKNGHKRKDYAKKKDKPRKATVDKELIFDWLPDIPMSKKLKRAPWPMN